VVRPARFEVTAAPAGAPAQLSVAGELDMKTAEVLAAHVERQLRTPVGALKLDLGELTFMDSSGLRLLIELYDRSRRDGWRLTLVLPRHEPAAIVLRATGADAALPFEPGAGP